LNWLKFRWLEGRVEAGLRNVLRAEEIFREVQEGLAEAGLKFQAALAALDLAEVLLNRKRADEAREIILKAVDIFKELGIDRERLMAVLLLRYAIERGTAAFALAEMLAEVIAFLRRAERDPNARFEPPLR